MPALSLLLSVSTLLSALVLWYAVMPSFNLLQSHYNLDTLNLLKIDEKDKSSWTLKTQIEVNV